MSRFARLVLIYTVFVILFGAWVRMSGSGAGCGEHWPLCDGQMIPSSPHLKQIYEYSHRVTSGLYGIAVLLLTIVGFRWRPKHRSNIKQVKERENKSYFRYALVASLMFTVIEALIGAILVKKGLVADNQSSMRAFVVAIHLTNTFFLLGAVTCVDYFVQGNLFTNAKIQKADIFITGAWLLVGAAGAVTALGDTLFPAETISQGLSADFSTSSPILVRLRILHPILAVSASALSLWWISRWTAATTSKILMGVICSAVLFGFVNIILLVPHWTALIHLLFADIIWILWIRWILSSRSMHSPANISPAGIN